MKTKEKSSNFNNDPNSRRKRDTPHNKTVHCVQYKQNPTLSTIQEKKVTWDTRQGGHAHAHLITTRGSFSAKSLIPGPFLKSDTTGNSRRGLVIRTAPILTPIPDTNAVRCANGHFLAPSWRPEFFGQYRGHF